MHETPSLNIRKWIFDVVYVANAAPKSNIELAHGDKNMKGKQLSMAQVKY